MAIILGIISGLSDALKNAVAKKNTLEFNELIVTWAWIFFASIFLVPLLLISKIPELNNTFWIALTLVTIIDFIAYYLYTLAIKLSDLSLTIPMLAFTPLFVLLSSIIINNEYPNPLGVVGIILVIGGAYTLNYRKNSTSNNLLNPIISIIREKGVFFMFLVALIWGLAGSLHKLAIDNAQGNSVFYAAISVVIIGIIYTIIVLIKFPKQTIQAFRMRNLKMLAPVGAFEAIAVLTQMMTQGLSLAAFAISLKRTSIIFSAILGQKYFGEKINDRIIPILIIVLGIILIAID